MKFDYIIGNPPYQEETVGTSDSPIYNYFMDESYKIGNIVELITPARFLFNGGKTPKEWNERMLADEHLKVIWYNPNSNDVFGITDIKGGIVITYRDKEQCFGAINMFTSFPQLNAILQKVLNRKGFCGLDSIIFSQTKWDLEKLYQKFPSAKNLIGSQGRERRLTTNIFSILSDLEVFHKSKNDKNDILIMGLSNKLRVSYYIDESFIDKNSENLQEYKVIVPKSNGSGAIGEVLSTPLIGEPLIGHTQSFISIGKFDNNLEAIHCLKYIKTKFARCMLGILKITQHNPPEKWKYVPLQDFTENSDIDWSKSIPEIDRQLYAKYGLDKDEMDFIETHVKAMD